MTTQTINALSTIQLSGNQVKQIKALYKGHKHNKKADILNHLLFQVSNNLLTITYNSHSNHSTNQLHIPVYAANTTFLLPIDTIKLLSHTKDSLHSLTIHDNQTIQLSDNGITQNINTLNFSEYPSHNHNESDFAPLTTLTPDTLNKLSLAALSVSASEARPILQHVLLRNDQIISTDSHRLYVSKHSSNLETDIHIHNTIINLIISLTEKGESVTLSHDTKGTLQFKSSNFTIYNQMLAGNYPEVSRLIPDSFQTVVSISEYATFKKILEAIKKADKKQPNAYINFNYNNQTISIHDKTNTIKAEIKMNTNYYDSTFTKIIFSASYMLEAMKQIEGKEITLKFIGAMRPFIVESEVNNDTKGLVLPVRINK